MRVGLILCIAIAVTAAGCSTSGPLADELRAPDAESARNANFVFSYETAYKPSPGAGSEVMQTHILLTYDPENGQVRQAFVESPRDGVSRREVTLAPDGRTLRLRIFTDLDGAGSTTVRLRDHQTRDWFLGGLGVTSDVNSLVEGVEIHFLEEGGWHVTFATGAHLIDAGGSVTRNMTGADGRPKDLVAMYP